MVTRASRVALAREAVADYAAQVYGGPTELVIVVERGDEEAASDLARCCDGARVVAAPKGTTLGELRRLSIRVAGGELCAQWDDDDRYHPYRLAMQVAALSDDADACCLTDQLYQFAPEPELYWVDWRKKGSHACHLIPGTIVARTASARRADYPPTRRGEDTDHLRELLVRGEVTALEDRGWCYLRRYHGNNTWSRNHFLANIRRLGMSRSQILDRAESLNRAVKVYLFCPDSPVQVRDANGTLALTLGPVSTATDDGASLKSPGASV